MAPEGRLLSSKPQPGASAALDEPFGVTATAADEAGTKVKSRQGVRLPNASESQILRELALPSRPGSNFELEVDLSIFIEEIVITPFGAAWQFSGIKGAIESLLKEAGAGQIKVRRSKHMLAPEIGWPPEIKARREGRRF